MTGPDDRLREQVETLDGSRSRDRSRAAVRVQDLDGLLKIQQRLQAAKAAGAAPTKAEFDALLTDVEFIRARLYEVMQALQGRLLR